MAKMSLLTATDFYLFSPFSVILDEWKEGGILLEITCRF